jgi:hypothetical protein
MTIDARERDQSAWEQVLSDAHERELSAWARSLAWLTYAPAERAPLLTVPVVWSAAEILHATGTGGYIPGAAAAVAASIAFGLGERRARKSEHPVLEGAELAAAVAVPGAWLFAASIWGPLWGPYDAMTSMIYTGISVLGYRWLWRRGAVRDARRRRGEAAEEAARLAAEAAAWLDKKTEWHRLAGRVGLQGSDLLRVEPNQNDSETWVIDTYGVRHGGHRMLAPQVDCTTVARRLSGEPLSIAGDRPAPVPMRRIDVEADQQWAYQLRITFRASDLWKDGSATGYVWHPCVSGQWDPQAEYADLVPEVASILDPVTLGGNPESGDPLQVTLYDLAHGAHRVLVVGTSGSGKSMLMDTLRDRITACADAILIQINLSKGVEESWWQPAAAGSALSSVQGDVAAETRAVQILEFVSSVILDRPRSRTPGVRVHQPTPDEPAIVLIIDEVDKAAAGREDWFGQIASTCRSEGVVLIIGGQRPQNQYIGGAQVRANITDIIWGRMRSSDRRQSGGADVIELPDMGDYGGGNAGVFGITPHPVFEGAPFQRGRGFFWGNTSPGLIQVIERRAANRVPFVLEPGLQHLAPQWAQITGAATDADRAEVAGRPARGPGGRRGGGLADLQAQLGAMADAKSAELQAQLTAIWQDEQARSGQPPAGAAGPDSGNAARDPLPGREQAWLWRVISRPEGASGREAARILTARSGRNWSHTWVTSQLHQWEAAGMVVRDDGGQGQSNNRWRPAAGAAPPESLHAVPDPAPDPAGSGGPATNADAAGPVREPDQVYGPEVLTPQDLIMMVASWALRDGPEQATASARHNSIPGELITRALDLVATDRAHVMRTTREILTQAGAPVPTWAGGPDDEDEALAEGGGHDEEGEAR